MKISNRLLSIANLVPYNSIVADIGTDHGYIPAYLINNKISKKVIGTDISKGSLEKIKEYVGKLGHQDVIDIRLGDGLEVIKPFEVDTVIIAGMGGLLIRDIIEKHRSISKSIVNFILQPMVASKELREYLMENNFQIVSESLLKEEGKYYEIIYAKSGKAHVKEDIYLEISPLLIEERHPLLKEFIHYKINYAKNIIEDLKDYNTEKSMERYEELTKLIKDYKKVLMEIES